MRYVAAYLLAVLGGNANPTEADIKKILSSVGIDADSKCIQKVVSELKGKDVEEVLAQGNHSYFYKYLLLLLICFRSFKHNLLYSNKNSV